MTTSFQEWSPVKELLTTLVQLLSLKTGGTPLSQGSEDAAFIAAGVFKNPFAFGSPSEPFSHTVRLLIPLQNIQSKMAHWIETLPSNLDRTVENFASKKENAKEQPTSDFQDRGNRFPPESSVKVVKPELLAQRLAGEVRSAIQTLSTSSFLSTPQPGPLRDALAKLKPLVDELIEALSKSTLDSHNDGTFTPFKDQTKNQKSQEAKKERIPFSFFQSSRPVFSDRALASEKTEPRVFSKSEPSPHKEPKRTSNDLLVFSGNEEVKSSETTSKKKDVSPDLLRQSFLRPETFAKMTIKENSKEVSSKEALPFPKVTAPNEAIENKSHWTHSSSPLISMEEETSQKAPDRIPIPTSLPSSLPSTFHRLLKAAKKKKQTRYFFKDDSPDDDESPNK